MNFYSHSFSWQTFSPDKGKIQIIWWGKKKKTVLFQKYFLSFFSGYFIVLKNSFLVNDTCLTNGQISDYSRKLLLVKSLQSVGNGKICRRITFSTRENTKEFQKRGHYYFRKLQTMLVFSKLELKQERCWEKERLSQGPFNICFPWSLLTLLR